MRLADVDLAAVSGTSALHRAAPRAKLAAVACVIAAVVVTTDARAVAGLAVVLLALAAQQRLGLRPLVLSALYPAFFAVVFAWAAGAGWVFGALIVGKAVVAALAVVMLARTTPYPQVIAPLQRVLPAAVADAFLFTYRSFFLLAEKASRLARAVRLRAGVHLERPVAAVRLSGRMLGGLLIYSMDLAQRDYDVMRLRGYERRLAVAPLPSRSRATDVALLAGAFALLALTVAWRFLA